MKETWSGERVSGGVERLADGSTRQTLGLVDRTTKKWGWYLYPRDWKRAHAYWDAVLLPSRKIRVRFPHATSY